jgi:hypothetical protein
MKVKFIESEGREQCIRQGSHELRSGSVYVVLGAECQSDGQNFFRIEYSSNDLPPLFDSRLFEVVDDSIDPNWTIRIGWDGSVTIQPEAWQQEGFWEDFTNYDPHAVESYRHWRDVLLAR